MTQTTHGGEAIGRCIGEGAVILLATTLKILRVTYSNQATQSSSPGMPWCDGYFRETLSFKSHFLLACTRQRLLFTEPAFHDKSLKQSPPVSSRSTALDGQQGPTNQRSTHSNNTISWIAEIHSWCHSDDYIGINGPLLLLVPRVHVIALKSNHSSLADLIDYAIRVVVIVSFLCCWWWLRMLFLHCSPSAQEGHGDAV